MANGYVHLYPNFFVAVYVWLFLFNFNIFRLPLSTYLLCVDFKLLLIIFISMGLRASQLLPATGHINLIKGVGEERCASDITSDCRVLHRRAF